ERFEFPEFGELEKDVIRIHPRDDEPRRAVEETAFQHVISKKGERRMYRDPGRRGTAAVFVHLLCRQRRVALDGIHVLGDITIGEMLQFSPQPVDRADDVNAFVDVPANPPSASSIVETKLVIRIPVRGPDPSPEMPRHTWYPESPMGWFLREHLLDFRGQRRCHAFVCVD